MADLARMRITVLHVTFGLSELRLVARPTIRRRSLIYSAYVTLRAISLHVRAAQRKRCVVMIEGCAFPSVRSMANRAILRVTACDVIRIRRSRVIRFMT